MMSRVLIASKETAQQIPDKSYDRYVDTYKKFVQWQTSKKVTSFDEEVLLAYFYEVAKTKAPTSLSTMFAMLKATINSKHNVDLARYTRLVAFLKKQNLGFQSKKSNVFTAEEIRKFLMEAPDAEYLGVKVQRSFDVFTQPFHLRKP